MQLIYRGVPYQSNSLQVQPVDSSLKGKYRGVAYQIQKSTEVVAKPAFKLTYRGVTYQTGVGDRVQETAGHTRLQPAII